jgi:hypothetical protein
VVSWLAPLAIRGNIEKVVTFAYGTYHNLKYMNAHTSMQLNWNIGGWYGSVVSYSAAFVHTSVLRS